MKEDLGKEDEPKLKRLYGKLKASDKCKRFTNQSEDDIDKMQ